MAGPGRRSGSASAGSLSDEVDNVLARFVIEGASCVIIPGNRTNASSRIGGFELFGERYTILKIGEQEGCDVLDALTPRELEIALLVAAGQESKAVARRLRISFHTVRVHLGRIYAKLGLHKQTELAVLISARYGARVASSPTAGKMRSMMPALVLPAIETLLLG